MNTISLLNTVNNDIPNSMIYLFFPGKGNELYAYLKSDTPAEKKQAQEMLVRLGCHECYLINKS